MEDDEELIESGLQDSINQLVVQNEIFIAGFLYREEEGQGGTDKMNDEKIIQMVQQPVRARKCRLGYSN